VKFALSFLLFFLILGCFVVPAMLLADFAGVDKSAHPFIGGMVGGFIGPQIMSYIRERVWN
jgi:hypothetical protein